MVFPLSALGSGFYRQFFEQEPCREQSISSDGHKGTALGVIYSKAHSLAQMVIGCMLQARLIWTQMFRQWTLKTQKSAFAATRRRTVEPIGNFCLVTRKGSSNPPSTPHPVMKGID